MENMPNLDKVTKEKIKKTEVEEFKNGEKEKKESDRWAKLKSDFGRYLTKIFTGYGKLEHPKPLSIWQNYKKERAEIKENTSEVIKRKSSKFLSQENGGPSPDKIRESALELARKLGWKEYKPESSEKIDRVFEMGVEESKDISKEEQVLENKTNNYLKIKESLDKGIPTFITNRLRADLRSFGITDQEVDKLKPREAWDLLQQKVLEKEIKEPKEDKIYTTEQVGEDFSMLQKMWEEAYEAMDNVNDDKRTSELLDLTSKAQDDPKILEEYLRNNNLKPEEKLFIEMSINIKKFRAKAKELVYEGVNN